MYKIDRPTVDRTVALVAKVPKSGRSCNTLRDSLEAAREGKKREKKKIEASRDSAKCEKAKRGARRGGSVRDTRERARRSGSPSNYVNKTFCSRFWECGCAGPPTEEKGYLPPLLLGPGFEVFIQTGSQLSGPRSRSPLTSRNEVERSERGHPPDKEGRRKKERKGVGRGTGRREEILPI